MVAFRRDFTSGLTQRHIHDSAFVPCETVGSNSEVCLSKVSDAHVIGAF